VFGSRDLKFGAAPVKNLSFEFSKRRSISR